MGDLTRRAICVTLPTNLYQALVVVVLVQRGSSQKKPSKAEIENMQQMGLVALLKDTNGCQRIYLTPAGWLLAENIPQVMRPQPPKQPLN